MFEDDPLNDDLLWQEIFTISSAELAAGLVDRTFNLVFEGPSDGFGDMLEILAKAEVVKDACGFLCNFDRPEVLINVNEAVVPVPAAAWLFGSALGLLGWIRRKAA